VVPPDDEPLSRHRRRALPSTARSGPA
jgi:hypothetical protein